MRLAETGFRSVKQKSDAGNGELCFIMVNGRRCSSRTVATVSISCLNEFPDTQRLCAKHTEMAQSGKLACFHCRDTNQGIHNVYVTRVKWD